MNEFAQYRKKPLVVRARQLDRPETVDTLEGTMHGDAGDYLVIGIAGEQYIVKRQIFLQTFEVVS